MSSEATPISASRFASALKDLSISSLHGKVSELRNSIAHLEASNTQLEEFVRQDNDKDCYEALLENKDVIKRMQERIELVRIEIVENRGMPFEPEEGKKLVQTGANGTTASNGESRENGTAGTSRNREEEGVFL
ncbi:hypothetical protein B0J11DRAFT_259584 [Dendryphion nanum]|uniref:Uncharacterized protein n=1 Tax=Dendryphion nanum TaxID=256645 RepID=A0A9P9E2F3_9PLEO|nr:hypothetical protein B0J11DRAFT_259584 [Dendryphion nanum]